MTARLEPKRVKGKALCRPIQEELNDNPYNIGSFLAGDDSVDALLSRMIDNISRAASADSIEDATTEMAEFSDLVDRYNGGKKYQNAIFGYLVGCPVRCTNFSSLS
jgi:hypothetical protein